MKPIKIAFVGTSCTGKTWLFETLRKRLGGGGNARFVEEAARAYFEEHPDVHNRFSFAVQASIQELALISEQQAKASLIFCDRSVLDAAAYIYAQQWYDGADFLVRRVKNWLPTYSKLYLLNPSDVAYAKDGIRDESEPKRLGFHAGFIELFAKYAIPYELLSGTKGDRVKTVEQFVDYVHP